MAVNASLQCGWVQDIMPLAVAINRNILAKNLAVNKSLKVAGYTEYEGKEWKNQLNFPFLGSEFEFLYGYPLKSVYNGKMPLPPEPLTIENRTLCGESCSLGNGACVFSHENLTTIGVFIVNVQYFACECKNGNTGPMCENSCRDIKCSGHGSCDESGTICVCDSNYLGEKC